MESSDSLKQVFARNIVDMFARALIWMSLEDRDSHHCCDRTRHPRLHLEVTTNINNITADIVVPLIVTTDRTG